VLSWAPAGMGKGTCLPQQCCKVFLCKVQQNAHQTNYFCIIFITCRRLLRHPWTPLWGTKGLSSLDPSFADSWKKSCGHPCVLYFCTVFIHRLLEYAFTLIALCQCSVLYFLIFRHRTFKSIKTNIID